MNFLCLLLLFLLLPSYITAQTECYNNVAGEYATDNYTAGSTYSRNLNALLTSIVTNSDSYNWSSGQPPNRVNAIWRCRGDLTPTKCRECMTSATTRILQECPNRKQAFGWYDTCMIQYSNRSLSGIVEQFPTYLFQNIGNVTDPIKFGEALETLLNRLRVTASRSSARFAPGIQMQENFRTIYSFLQCKRDLTSEQCDRCLSDILSQLSNCCGGKVGGGVYNPSCGYRYDAYRFLSEPEAPPPAPTTSPPAPPLNNSPPPPASQGIGGNKSRSRIIAIVVPIVGALVLGFMVFLFCCRRKLKRSRIVNKGSSQNGMTAGEISHDGPMQFDFDIIDVATNEFAYENKLGEGGFGAVYKGTLSNGEKIAVKRLDKDSRQGDLEFKNEVQLVAKLQHRNLVRLLGFCLEERERLLIYEFVPNASLDRFLFDPNQRSHLNWERRYKIIGGIARGLVYLHEDSRLKIIHRDLKVSNILLDEDMNPKIADFGMARLFDIDETQHNTSRIVGTYGYMAPEYAYHGQFSVKSDVFSFGVLVLEIVSGHKVNSFRHGTNMEDLLSDAWKNWNDGTCSNIVDPALDNVSGTEIARCIHIGLLCVQENVNDRPTMTSVILMLTSISMTLQLPSKPAFFMQTRTEESWGQGSSQGYSNTSKERIGSSTSTETLPVSRNDVTITELYPR